ncbi:MAG: metallophosphoesterase family protein [Planctomycetaceae bacterium]|nr:metallophosphoesterase family protein [Planctomycetaceae bacterium]
MHHLNRRGFLGTSLGGLTALSLGGRLIGDDAAPVVGAVPQAPYDSLFLTWQQDPTTTVTIQWVGPEVGAQVPLQFAPHRGTIWQPAAATPRPFRGTDLKVYRCELTGLSPGAEYKFQVGQQPAVYRFRTMPAKATDEFCFVSGGDAVVGENAVKSNVMAAKQEPHFVLIGGDVAYDNGRSPETFYKFLQNYSSTMVDSQGRLIPLVCAIGNHEVDRGDTPPRERATSFLSVFDGFFPEKTFGVLDFGDYLSLVLLDTGHVEPIGGEQTDWLAQTLKDRQDLPHVIVAHHVPCYPSVRNPYGVDGKFGTGEEQRQHWCPLFEQYKIDLALEHHDHAFKRTHPLTNGLYDKNGVLYLGDGSWGKLRVPSTPEERPYLAKTSSAYHVSLHRFEGDQRYHVALEDSGKVADVLTTFSKRASRRG